MKPLTTGDALGLLRVLCRFDEQGDRIYQAAAHHDRAAAIHLLVELAHACDALVDVLDAEGADHEGD